MDKLFRIAMGLGLIAWIALMVTVQTDYEYRAAIADGDTGQPPIKIQSIEDPVEKKGVREDDLADDWGAAIRSSDSEE
ncbi:hypothetical protein QWY75_00665 [Pontixanthobacter aestiaquae]|uniref:Uncharacterized protein n=1 Tax=Pontixanthobacter aestiaquae TaxID=1509367 RepID=A0A844ZB08_9SPHN|nr:hypothetical protein [Pontixanthobacter aestiaquae]MDN3644710.1 hypothetical protein [Pontixanthobacter aestiaquae]MXO84283.1 hypothetical protein [Pontixanthobacter aestiaquae]